MFSDCISCRGSIELEEKKAIEGDDEFFEKFQQQQKKREKLETKAKISHRVFCPFFPDVRK